MLNPIQPISILIVDDSTVVRRILSDLLASTPTIEVAATSKDGIEGIAAIAQHDPDVVLADLSMPNMDGFQFTQKIIELYPRPILIVSESVQSADVDNIFRLMEMSATLDFFPKPVSGTTEDYQKLQSMLIAKIRALALRADRAKSANF